MDAVLQFQYGATTAMCIIIGVFFWRFWRLQRDRFFGWFMAAFWSFAASWSAHLWFATSHETGPHFYLFRLLGFILIIIAIVDKNRRAL